MASCWHKESIKRRGNATEFGKAIASWTGRNAWQSSRVKKARASTQAVAADINIMKPAANASCHESRRMEGVRVDPVLDTTSDGRKRRAHTRLIVRHVSLVSRAGNTATRRGERYQVHRDKLKEREGGYARRSYIVCKYVYSFRITNISVCILNNVELFLRSTCVLYYRRY